MDDERSLRDAMEELRALKARRSRDAAKCPIRYFSTEGRPHQTAFFHDQHPIQGVSAGRRAGKTFCAGAARPIIAMTGIQPIAKELRGALDILPKPPVRVRVWCMDLVRMVKNVVRPFLKELLPPDMIDRAKCHDIVNEKDATCYLKNGSTYEVLSYELRKGKGESAEKDIVYCDEVPPYEIFTGQKLRLLTPREVWSYMWIGGTRSGDAMPWNVQWFEDEIVRWGAAGNGAVSHHEFDTEENLEAVARERGGDDPEAYAERQAQIIGTLSEEERAVFIGGKSDRTSLTVFPMYSETGNRYNVGGVSPETFVKLAASGYGDVWCGMDHGFGSSGATALVYVFIARKDIREIKVAKGDFIQIGEYYRRNARVIVNIRPLQELHRRFNPKGYFVDLHAWDRDAALVGMSAAMLYSDPKRLRDVTAALHPDVDMTDFDLTPIAPLYRAGNKAKSLDGRIQLVAGLLLARQGEVDWPRYRVMEATSPMTCKAFRGWQRKKDPETGLPGDKYSKYLKDCMDAVGYLCVANPLQFEDDSEPTSVRVGVDAFTGLSMAQLCPLAGGIAGGLQ